MDVRHIGTIALLAIMAVAALFFFPAAHGPYSSTHGPITALRSLRLRAFLFFVIAAASAALCSMVHTLVAIGRFRCTLFTEPLFSPGAAFAPLRR